MAAAGSFHLGEFISPVSSLKLRLFLFSLFTIKLNWKVFVVFLTVSVCIFDLSLYLKRKQMWNKQEDFCLPRNCGFWCFGHWLFFGYWTLSRSFFHFFCFNSYVYIYIYIVCHRTYLDYIIELEEFLFNKKMFYLYSLYCATETLQWFISNFSFRMNLEICNYLTLFVFSKGLSWLFS